MVVNRGGDTDETPAVASAMVGDTMQASMGFVVSESTAAQPAQVNRLNRSTGAGVDTVAAVQTVSATQQVATSPTPSIGGGAWEHVDVEVSHSLARTFQRAVGEESGALAAVYSRLFMWDLDLRRDVLGGDRISVVYRVLDDGSIEIPVASYTSGRLRQTLYAYQYTAPGDAYPSYWTEDGVEVPKRLIRGPLNNYEQITSLLKDRPTHRGMDFKLDIGGDVVSPRAGTVTRVNWNTGANGGCVEVRFADGTLAKFLHLSGSNVRPNQHVREGEVIASSGNTGRSTGPHLHYQLDRNGRNIDPVDYHGTERRQISQSAGFLTEVNRLNGLLGR
jgi:murein DD-endopeptidase MepM/ murein hydrolase activator NlpD